MRLPSTLRLLLLIAIAGANAGCLNLGGRTTHINENPDTARRLSWLESRVSTLEQITRGASAPPSTVGEVSDQP